MELQRKYGIDGTVSHVKIVHTGKRREQVFSRRFVTEGAAAGWLSLSADTKTLTIKAEPENLVYEVERAPGYYTLDGTPIPISQLAWTEATSQISAVLAAQEAQAWCAANGLPSTAYTVTHNYHCKLDAAQQERYQGVTLVPGRMVAAHQLEG